MAMSSVEHGRILHLPLHLSRHRMANSATTPCLSFSFSTDFLQTPDAHHRIDVERNAVALAPRTFTNRERGRQWKMSSSSSSSQTLERSNVQNVIVMRHGDRLDNFEPLWVASAKRPWDPPLTEVGKIRAWNTGKKLRKNLGFKIDRVFVSPFLRCIQTAYEAISALCAQGDYDLMETSENVIIDPSTVKVSIEYGLCEALSREAISIDLVPKDGIWLPDLSELEAILPAGTLDHSVERVYKELPKWEEPIENARRRYKEVIMALADKYPHENLLLVTHGEGVGVSVSAFLKATVYEVEYCACSHLQRPISFKSTGKHTAQEFKVLTDSNTGILFM